jgi:uncharacterized protein (UPF0332 family)
MMSENVKALASYRLGQAEESLAASEVLLDQDLIRSSVNRSYYAMFYAVLALLAARGEETSKHSGAIALFDRAFVKSGVFPKEFSRGQTSRHLEERLLAPCLLFLALELLDEFVRSCNGYRSKRTEFQ